MVVHHAGRVIHSQADLVLPLARLGPPQPDLVFAELASDVGDDLTHVQTLACAEVSPVVQGERKKEKTSSLKELEQKNGSFQRRWRFTESIQF